MQIEFDEATHIYRVDNKEVPSVTQVLKSVNLIETNFYTAYGADRGRKIHSATALDDQGVLDEDALDYVLMPYLAAWRAFRTESGFRPLRIEERLYSPTYGFAGTIDRYGQFQGVNTVVEIKSGSPEPWHQIQTGAYRLLLNLNQIKCVKRIAVYLSETGYKIEYHNNGRNDAMFLSALSIFNFRKNGGE